MPRRMKEARETVRGFGWTRWTHWLEGAMADVSGG